MCHLTVSLHHFVLAKLASSSMRVRTKIFLFDSIALARIFSQTNGLKTAMIM